MSRTVTFKLEKQTPGALRYAETNEQGHPIKGDDEGAMIGSLYLRKAAMNGKVPESLTITVNV